MERKLNHATLPLSVLTFQMINTTTACCDFTKRLLAVGLNAAAMQYNAQLQLPCSLTAGNSEKRIKEMRSGELIWLRSVPVVRATQSEGTAEMTPEIRVLTHCCWHALSLQHVFCKTACALSDACYCVRYLD